jgi:hypothetical protein
MFKKCCQGIERLSEIIAAVFTGGYDRQTLESTERESSTAQGWDLFLNNWMISPTNTKR